MDWTILGISQFHACSKKRTLVPVVILISDPNKSIQFVVTRRDLNNFQGSLYFYHQFIGTLEKALTSNQLFVVRLLFKENLRFELNVAESQLLKTQYPIILHVH